MIYRKFNAPNVEYNEIDRSQYRNDTDSSAVGTMSFIIGFADMGHDYDAQYSTSIQDFISEYGYPTNEAERYFYNAAKEVFSKGGRTITAKIPYENESKDKFPFTAYKADSLNDNGEVDLKSVSGKYDEILDLDNSITSYFELKSVSKSELANFVGIADNSLMNIEEYDEILVGRKQIPKNSMIIIDITRNKYSKDSNFIDVDNSKTQNYLGYVPVVVSPINALFYQRLINPQEERDISSWNIVDSLQTIPNENGTNVVDYNEISSHFMIPLASNETSTNTVSKIAAGFFPTIRFIKSDRLDKSLLKQIGVVIFKMIADASDEGKIKFTPVESYIGSLDRNAVDPITKKNIFIDNIVNENSSTINLFSNFNFSNGKNSSKASTILINNQTATTLGFFESQCVKGIRVSTIESTLDLIFENCKNPSKVPIDIIIDGGMSNIAQYIASIEATEESSDFLFYEPEYDFEGLFSLKNANDSAEWKKIINKFDSFAKYIRKDCIFIADGLRSFCLEGNQPIVRRTAPYNTIDAEIIPKIKWMIGPNSSYSAGYCNWFKCLDDTSGIYFWCPPSIKALGVYLYTDRYAQTWDAPAGDTRGRIEDAVDIAFNPTIEEAQGFYEQQWNYAVAYPTNGIVLEGQKTFQVDRTALDRVNIRRLCLAVKNGIREIARWFKYEGITPLLLTRFRDQLSEFLFKVKSGYGISEYYIKLDEENNTPETIDRNEIHASIAIRPVKSAEFIVINSIIVNQSADLEEVTQSVLS